MCIEVYGDLPCVNILMLEGDLQSKNIEVEGDLQCKYIEVVHSNQVVETSQG